MTALDDLIKILFWVARSLILLLGCGYGLYLIVKGQSDENPRDLREGLTYIVGSGVIFAATFAIEKIF